MGRPPKKFLRERLNISLPRATIEAAKAAAYDENYSLSELIEHLLVEHMGGPATSSATAGNRPAASSRGRKTSASATRHTARAKAEQ